MLAPPILAMVGAQNLTKFEPKVVGGAGRGRALETPRPRAVLGGREAGREAGQGRWIGGAEGRRRPRPGGATEGQGRTDVWRKDSPRHTSRFLVSLPPPRRCAGHRRECRLGRRRARACATVTGGRVLGTRVRRTPTEPRRLGPPGTLTCPRAERRAVSPAAN